jgi:cell wall-associated NlpC family hydrolase
VNPALAAAAATLIGVRFRLHGRDPESGLDCVGLVAEAMRRAGSEPAVPHGYRLRAVTVAGLLPFADANGFVRADRAEQGDVVLAMVSLVQPHLLIRAPGGFIHAHAGLGRVTYLPGSMPWPLASAWHVPTPHLPDRT